MMPVLCTPHGKRKPVFSRQFQTGHHWFLFNLVPVPNPSKRADHSNPDKNLPFESGRSF
jgi:hypothetical protein